MQHASASRFGERTIAAGALGCVCVALALAFGAAPAAGAAKVVKLGADGRARTVVDRAVPATADFVVRPAPRRAASASLARRAQAPGRTVIGELTALRDSGQIDPATYDQRRGEYESAREELEGLSGRRELELGGVLANLDAIAASGQLTPSRLNALWLTLDANVEWWTTGPLLSSGQRVERDGSRIVWQYYAGEGIQIQVLGTFGKLNYYARSRRISDATVSRLVDEMLALPAERAGGIAWEYYFDFGVGAPPWASGMAQATGMQALSRAARRLGREAEIYPIASRALGIFERPSPEGVRLDEPDGPHYLLYSFDPDLRVLNGFAQALIGLHDFAELSGDPRAQALFAAGDVVARRETPLYDTGYWSLYSLGRVANESTLSYHQLVRDFMRGLCERTEAEPYCNAEAAFTAYETEDPVLRLRSRRLRGGKVGRLKYDVTKVSRVGIEVRRAGRLVLSRTVSSAPHGTRYVEWDVPRRAGTYTVSITAVDLAGNAGTTSGSLKVLKPKPKKAKRKRRRP
ncbi:MAG TPA: D-glucuronyl C5-epimerase family protein [Solirubrobacteraceae bacterium]